MMTRWKKEHLDLLFDCKDCDEFVLIFRKKYPDIKSNLVIGLWNNKLKYLKSKNKGVSKKTSKKFVSKRKKIKVPEEIKNKKILNPIQLPNPRGIRSQIELEDLRESILEEKKDKAIILLSELNSLSQKLNKMVNDDCSNDDYNLLCMKDSIVSSTVECSKNIIEEAKKIMEE